MMYKDATLASVLSDAENQFIYTSLSIAATTSYWIGMFKISQGQCAISPNSSSFWGWRNVILWGGWEVGLIQTT